MNAPTLLIGLGGTGCKIVKKVADLVSPEQRKNISVVMFDTDVNELREVEANNPFVKTVQTSTKQNVGEYLDRDRLARDEWFPTNGILNRKTLTEGAGQIRAISRLALETVIGGNNMVKLEEAVNDLYKVAEAKEDQCLRVTLVSSLAGGTGSGLILPVALYLGKILGTRAKIVRGFFILPEVFFEVIQGHEERSNLKANAYATLRELDAFLMKADNNLPEKYKNTVTMKFPMPGTGYQQFEEYNVSPYDFCFLFDAQNVDGEKLNSFAQYLDHAANCIYAQSIGPMNKRSNSSEDNKIRALIREAGRNRYAGAGASVLKYPFEDVRKFVALQWAKECVSKQWLVYDMEYKALCEENRALEEEGFGGQIPDARQQYVLSVENAESRNDPFARMIVRSCKNYKPDGTAEDGTRCEDYVAALKEKTEAMEDIGADDVITAAETLESQLGNLGTEYKKYKRVYDELIAYYEKVTKHIEENSRSTAFSMFKSSRAFRTTKPEKFEIEYYLTTTEGNFIHPNAIRYFLIKTYNLLKDELELAAYETKSALEAVEEFKNLFDDPNTKQKETSAVLSNKQAPITAQVTHQQTSDQKQYQLKFRDFYDNVNNYKSSAIRKAVLETGCGYLSDLIEAFEMFYGIFDIKVSSLDKVIGGLRKKYSNRIGSTMRYVCADATCMDGLYKKMQYTGGGVSIDPQLSKEIYYKVLDYATMKEKPANNRFFTDLFDDGIVGYYEDYVMKKYGDNIDIDIIQALETEAVMVHPEYVGAEDEADLIEQYVKKIISNTKKLSSPFIEKPVGEEANPIFSCAFNKDMQMKYLEDPSKADIIKRELMNFGGVADNDIPKNEVMFYQAIYALRANSLSKFAPEKDEPTAKRPAGEYFKSYYELVTKIHPDSMTSKEMSPHLDRWWHVVTKMPDLDEKYQEKQEKEINAAFFWALLNGYVFTMEDGSGRIKYIIAKEELDMASDELLVSNGTPCDKLYEVLDAIAIYPEFIQAILRKVQKKKDNDQNRCRTWDNGILCRQLDDFKMDDPGLGKVNARKDAYSIFTIPHLMKKASTPAIYFEESVLDILAVELEEIEKYLLEYFNAKEMPEYFDKIVRKQFELYLKDLEVEVTANPSIYRETLFFEICTKLAKRAEELGCEELEEHIKKTYKNLKNA